MGLPFVLDRFKCITYASSCMIHSVVDSLFSSRAASERPGVAQGSVTSLIGSTASRLIGDAPINLPQRARDLGARCAGRFIHFFPRPRNVEGIHDIRRTCVTAATMRIRTSIRRRSSRALELGVSLFLFLRSSLCSV